MIIKMKGIVLTLLCTLVCSVLSTAAYARYASDPLENKLLTALHLTVNADGALTRNGNYGAAIQGYMRKGLINNKPDLYRSDYVDYYLLRKPAYLLGHELKAIEEEYMSAYVGCCASEGVGVVLKLSGNTQRLRNFAKKNRCNIEPIDLNEYLDGVGVNYRTVRNGRYVEMSCRQRDIDRYSN